MWCLSPRCSWTTPWLYQGGVEFPTHTLGLHLVTYTLGHMSLCCLPPLLDFTGKPNWLHHTITLFVLGSYDNTFNISLDNYSEFLLHRNISTPSHARTPVTHKRWILGTVQQQHRQSNFFVVCLEFYALRNELNQYLHWTWERATSCECHFLDPNGNRHLAKDK